MRLQITLKSAIVQWCSTNLLIMVEAANYRPPHNPLRIREELGKLPKRDQQNASARKLDSSCCSGTENTGVVVLTCVRNVIRKKKLYVCCGF